MGTTGASSYAILCTDGSELALRALRAGVALLGPTAHRYVVVTAVERTDPSMAYGSSGFAGGVMSVEEITAHDERHRAAGEAAVQEVITALGLSDAEPVLVESPAGPAICDLAASLPAEVVVIGSRGHGGLRRAVLGSVSDHVVRHAPCPVLIVGHDAVEDLS
jgi:nucleotide-binding universal stress UspA family protein